MKNIIHDQKYVVLGIVARSSSLPANQNSKIKIQKSRPLSLTPCFSKVWQSLTATNGFNRLLRPVETCYSKIFLPPSFCLIPRLRAFAHCPVSCQFVEFVSLPPSRLAIHQLQFSHQNAR
jgi:hypothetical protein